MVQKHEPEVELAETFARMARSLLAEPDVNRTLDRICKRAVVTVGGCEAAGVSMISGRRISPVTTTDELPRRLDDLQSEVGQGPSVDAIREREVFITGSLSEEPRWPEFSSRAHQETGVQSVLSLRLFANEEHDRHIEPL